MHKILVIAFILFVGSITIAAEERSVSEEDVFALQPSAEAGDRMAIRKLFELAPYSDGAAAEDIDVALGRTIRNHPQLFLEELRRSSSATCDRCFPGLVGNTGDELVDRFDDQAKELTQRRKALASVNKKSLADLRKKLLRVLDKQIEEAKDAAKDEKERAR